MKKIIISLNFVVLWKKKFNLVNDKNASYPLGQKKKDKKIDNTVESIMYRNQVI
jgi:hypothetical protein